MEINIFRMKDGKCPISYHHIVQGNKETTAQKQQTGKRKYWRRQHMAFPSKQENSIDQLRGLLLRIHLEKLQSSYYWRRQHMAFPSKQENSIDQLCGLLLRIHLEKLQSSYLQA